jgi:hypothetical protein
VIKFVSGFSQGTPVSSTNITDRLDIAEILLKVALNTISLTLTLKQDYRKKQLFFIFKVDRYLPVDNVLLSSFVQFVNTNSRERCFCEIIL